MSTRATRVRSWRTGGSRSKRVKPRATARPIKPATKNPTVMMMIATSTETEVMVML